MGTLLYKLSRHEFSGISLLRWLQILLGILALAAGGGLLPGRWVTAGALLLLALGLTGLHHTWRRQDFVRFIPQEAPSITPQALPPTAKLPIFASGFFGVEGKFQHFTWLQGFWRTFATREHAVICLVPPSQYMWVGQWPHHEVGMWYCFFKPHHIQEIHWGQVQYADQSLPAIAVDYRIRIPARHRFQRDRDVVERIVLAVPEPGHAAQILADLLYDLHPPLEQPPHPNGAGQTLHPHHL